MRQLNFDLDDFESGFQQEPRRRNRRHEDDLSGDKHEISLGSLEVSKITEEKYKKSMNSSENDHTITISPPALKDRSKGSEYDRTSKELGLDTNSPSDDFEINEKDLDENCNENIYTDEGFEELEKQCQDEQSDGRNWVGYAFRTQTGDSEELLFETESLSVGHY